MRISKAIAAGVAFGSFLFLAGTIGLDQANELSFMECIIRSLIALAGMCIGCTWYAKLERIEKVRRYNRWKTRFEIEEIKKSA